MPQEVWNLIGFFLSAVLLALLISHFLGQFVRVRGSSMEHTLKNGDVLLVTKPGKYRRGEAVICRYPRRVSKTLEINGAFSLTWHTLFVKRLVALPGDSVEIREGQLFVNDAPVPDPPEMASIPRDYARRQLSGKEYFVIGDNRSSSHDSRAADVGPLRREMLQGHVKAVLWPPKRIKIWNRQKDW